MIQPTVFVVDDDRAVRDSLVWMLKREGVPVEAYAMPSELLQVQRRDKARMPGA